MKANHLKELQNFRTLLAVGIFAIIFNVIAVLYLPTYVSRSLRFIGSTILISSFLISFPKQRNSLLLVLIAFWMRDISAIFYGTGASGIGYFICGGIGYFALFFRKLKRMMRYKIITPSFLVTTFFIIAFILILYTLESVFDESVVENSIIYYFYFLGTSILLLVLLAIYYYYRIGGMRALLFSFAVFSFTLSDIAAYYGIFLEESLFFIATRIFYFVGLLTLINFTITEAIDDEGTVVH